LGAVAKRRIIRFEHGSFSHDPAAELAEEAMLHVEINETASFDVVVTPQHLEEFVVGYLLCEGYIADPKEVTKLKLYEKDRIARADVTVDSPRVKTLAFRKNYNIIWTECGTAEAFYRMLGEKVPQIRSDVTITPAALSTITCWGAANVIAGSVVTTTAWMNPRLWNPTLVTLKSTPF